MTIDEKFSLITRNLEEVLTKEELIKLLTSNTPLRHYIGFEISGKVHLGTGLACMLKIRDLQEAGVHTMVLLADWHTWLNDKLDGTLETANKMARSYFEEALKAAGLCVGVDINKIEFVLGSNLYAEKPEFWTTTVRVSKATTISRMMRSTTIMGRKAGESSNAAILIYPAMQAADIFTIGVNIAHGGTDQRNAHVVARDVTGDLKQKKPVAIHHHLLQGLIKPPTWPIPEGDREEMVLTLKMSKSKPDSAVFIHDSPDEIKRKVNNAFCPEGEVKFNPILDWVKWLIFYESDTVLNINKDPKHGENLAYSSYASLEQDFADKKLHPQDLKAAVIEWLTQKLEPARKYFEDPKRKAALAEMERLTSG